MASEITGDSQRQQTYHQSSALLDVCEGSHRRPEESPHIKSIHCSPVTLYRDTDIGKYWLRWWLVTCMTAPGRYLNQRWLIIVMSCAGHSAEGILIRLSEDTNHLIQIENCIFRITFKSPRDQRAKRTVHVGSISMWSLSWLHGDKRQWTGHHWQWLGVLFDTKPPSCRWRFCVE